MHYEVTVEIEAPPEVVWAILADVERWPEWTASMTSVRRLDQGELRIGSEARVKQPRLLEATWRVTDLEPGSSFTWVSRSPGLTTVGGHRIAARDARRSAVTLTIDQAGLAAALVRPLTAGLTRRYMGLESAGLKRRCKG